MLELALAGEPDATTPNAPQQLTAAEGNRDLRRRPPVNRHLRLSMTEAAELDEQEELGDQHLTDPPEHGPATTVSRAAEWRPATIPLRALMENPRDAPYNPATGKQWVLGDLYS